MGADNADNEGYPRSWGIGHHSSSLTLHVNHDSEDQGGMEVAIPGSGELTLLLVIYQHPYGVITRLAEEGRTHSLDSKAQVVKFRISSTFPLCSQAYPEWGQELFSTCEEIAKLRYQAMSAD